MTAERVSLSPNAAPISFTEMASFSLKIGTALYASSVSIVLLRLSTVSLSE